MFSEIWLIYLITRLDVLLTFAKWGLAITVAAAFASIFIASSMIETRSLEDDGPMIARWWRKFAFVPIVSLLLIAFVPSQEDMKFIIAGTGLIEVAKSDSAQRVASKSVQVVEQYLDTILNQEKKETK